MTIAYPYRRGTLYLNLTNQCPNRCVFCVRRGSRGRLGAYDLALAREPSAREVLQAVAERDQERGERYSQVVFCGFGEPTARLNVLSRVGVALREQGRRVRLNTNGQAALLAGEDPFPLLTPALHEVSVSLNAPDADRYEALCRPRFGGRAWTHLLAFLERSARVFPGATTATVVGFVLDEDDQDRCRTLAERLGVRFRVR